MAMLNPESETQILESRKKSECRNELAAVLEKWKAFRTHPISRSAGL